MPFPSTSLITEFDGPAENPLSEGGKWIQARSLRPPLKKDVGSVSDSIHGDPNYSVYIAQAFCTNNGAVEAWACSGGGQLGAALETWRIALWKNLFSVSGYQVYYGGGIGKGTAIWRYDNDDFFAIGGAGDTGYPSGIGIRITGSQVQAWMAYGDPYDPLAWIMTAEATDNAHRGCFYASIGIEDPTGGGLGFGCFGGGPLHRTQFYRWLPALTPVEEEVVV